MLTLTITQKGQITIQKIRDTLNLKANARVVFARRGDPIILKPLRDVLSLRGVIKVNNAQNFSEIRKHVQNEIAERIGDEQMFR